MPSSPAPRSAIEIELTKLSSPRIFLVRMLVFLVLCALVMVVLYKQIIVAFFANPGLNALIGAVLLIGTILSFRQVIRLYPEVAWVNNFRIADPGLAAERQHPTLLAPMAAILGGERTGRMTITQQTMRHLLDFDRHAARRGPRHFPLHDRPFGVPRPARHVLGPDRNRRLGRQGDRRPQSRRRRRRAVRYAQGRTGRPARRHGHFVFVLAVRPRRFADPGLSRSTIKPGAEPVLYRPRRLARLHRTRIFHARPAPALAANYRPP